MSKIMLDKIKAEDALMQQRIEAKLKSDEALTDTEIDFYKLNDEDKEVFQMFKRAMDGEEVPGFTLKDFLGSPQAKILIPRVVVGTMRKSMDPNYLASKFFKNIRLKNGQAIMFPSIGVMRAHDIAEGQEIDFGVSVA